MIGVANIDDAGRAADANLGPMRLYAYWRSSAAYRVRIGLNLKGIAYEVASVHLLRDGGQQHAADYTDRVNPQALIPVLEHDGRMLRQSLAILEYLEQLRPEPALLPADAFGRQRARAQAQLIACDIHPLNNLRVIRYLGDEFGAEPAAKEAWSRHWMRQGFSALEQWLAEPPHAGTFCGGDAPGLADCCLVPQLYNARRLALDLTPYPTLLRIEAACLALPAFQQASPERQPDAVASA